MNLPDGKRYESGYAGRYDLLCKVVSAVRSHRRAFDLELTVEFVHEDALEVLHSESDLEPLALAEEDVIDVEAAAEHSLEIALTLRDDKVGGGDEVSRLVREGGEICFADEITYVMKSQVDEIRKESETGISLSLRI